MRERERLSQLEDTRSFQWRLEVRDGVTVYFAFFFFPAVENVSPAFFSNLALFFVSVKTLA